MRSVVVMVVLTMVFAVGAAFAQSPAITSDSGSFAKGAVISVSGSNFGAKSVPSPFKYDDFDAGSNNSTVGNGWGLEEGGGASTLPQYSTNILRANSDLSVRLEYFGTQYLNSIGTYDMDNGLANVYIDYWMYIDRPLNSPVSRNHKIFRLYTTRNAGLPNHYLATVCYEPRAFMTNDGVDGGWNDTHSYSSFPMEDFNQNWVHIQGYFEQSDAGVANGTLKLWINGREEVNRTDSMTRGNSNQSDWKSIWFGNYYSNGTDHVCEEASMDTEIYLDNVYVDKTQARIEIGNNPDYGSCTHREIQIPQSWSNSDINFVANPGAFGDGDQVWVFVVDESGDISPGYGPITVVGGVVQEGPGQPGRPIRDQ